MIDIKANRLSGGGICAALCVIMLLLGSVIPNLKLAFLFASSLLMGICLLRYKILSAILCYISVSVISVFMLPDKFVAMAFLILFGNYPIIKFYIEKIRNIYIEYILKFLVSNVYLVAFYVILKALDAVALFDFNTYILYIVGLALLLFYDLVFGFVINAFYKSYYKYLK